MHSTEDSEDSSGMAKRQRMQQVMDMVQQAGQQQAPPPPPAEQHTDQQYPTQLMSQAQEELQAAKPKPKLVITGKAKTNKAAARGGRRHLYYLHVSFLH